MNYSEMTDFEINKAVGEILLEGKWACKPGCAGNQSDSWNYGSVDTFVTPYPALPDYCNSWADAGPIILANKITISAPMEYDQPADWLAYPASDSDICVSHPNPLRAAMTAFLVVQESKNA